MSAPDAGRRHPLPPQRVVVTGGAGYIGSQLASRLAEDGHQVTVLDDLSGGPRRIRARLRRSDVRLVKGSVLDSGLVDGVVAGAGTVFHLAAAVGVGRIIRDPLRSLRVNLIGTDNVLSACARHGSAVVFASSSEVYGRPRAMPMTETGPQLLGPTTVPRWSYAAAKAAGEHLVFAHATGGLRASAVRYFNAYGPGLNRGGDSSVVSVFFRRAFAGEPLLLHGSGTQTRCFTYIDDIVTGTVLAASVPRAQGQVFNLGSATETSIWELAEMIVATAGSVSPIRRVPYESVYGARFEDVPRRVPDIGLARRVLGWEPRVGLAEGIKRTAQWWGEGDD